MLRERFVEDAAWKTAGESVPRTRQTGSLSRESGAAPSGKDTLERRVPRTQKSNVEIERMEIIKAGGEPVSLYYLT